MNWNQLKMVLWLRWRLTRNQFSRGGKLNAVLAVLGAVMGVMFSMGAGVAGLVGGAIGLAQASPTVMMVVWDVVIGIFLFVWLIGVFAEIQRAESIDVARLLHLPVSLHGVFVMNYIASLITPSLIFFLPGMLGLCVGLLWSKGWLMILLAPLVLSFLFLVSAWTYCLRGWLSAMMVNPRKRRNVVVIATIVFLLMTQVPNLYFQVYLRHTNRKHKGVTSKQNSGAPKSLPPGYLSAHQYVPLLWLPNGASALSVGNAWPAVWGSMTGLLIGAAGLARAYRSTIRFYQGNEKASKVRAPAKAVAAGGRNFLEKQVPLVSEEVGVLSLATFRSFCRAPELKMALFTNVAVVFGAAAVSLINVAKAPGEVAGVFMATGAVALTMFGLLQLLLNQFGYDREGFRALVLLPVRRRDVLLSKNLALAPFGLGLGVALLLVLAVLMHLPLLAAFAAGLQLVAIFLLFNIVGNFFSILLPYRIASGSLKPAKPPPKTVLVILLTQLCFPFVITVIFIPPLLGLLFKLWMDWSIPLVDAFFSILLLGLAMLVYRWSLASLGEMLERREKDILLVVTHEAE
jgi:ABC-2 type transport system permease protein